MSFDTVGDRGENILNTPEKIEISEAKQTLLESLEQFLPEDSRWKSFWDGAEKWSGSEEYMNVAQSKSEFIDEVRNTPLANESIKVLQLVLNAARDDFYPSTRIEADFRAQFEAHRELAQIIFDFESSIINQLGDNELDHAHLVNLFLNGIRVLRSETLSVEQLDKIKEEIALFQRLGNLIYDFYSASGNIDADLFKEKTEFMKVHMWEIRNINPSALDGIEDIIERSAEIVALKDMLERYKGYMPKKAYDKLGQELEEYHKNPLSFGELENDKMLGHLESSKQHFENIKSAIISQADIAGKLPDLAFSMKEEPFKTLFSAITTQYIMKHQDDGMNAIELIKSTDKNGLLISSEDLRELMVSMTPYFNGLDLSHSIEFTLQGGKILEITTVIERERAEIELKNMKETQRVLAFFRLFNNESLPSSNLYHKPSIEDIAGLLSVTDLELIGKIKALESLSSIEQGRLLDGVLDSIAENIKLGVLTAGEVAAMYQHFLKPGTVASLDFMTASIESGIIDSSVALEIFEGENGLKPGQVTLSEYLRKNHFPVKMRKHIQTALTMDLPNEDSLDYLPEGILTEDHLDHLLVDMLYLLGIESYGGWNINNGEGPGGDGPKSSAKAYMQALTENGGWNSKGKRLTNSFETGLRRIPKVIRDEYPGLKKFYSEIPRNKNDVLSGRVPDPASQDPKELTAEEQMIWIICDLYRRDSGKIRSYGKGILRGNFKYSKEMYARVHHTEGYKDEGTNNLMGVVAAKTLDKAATIIKALPNAPTLVARSDTAIAELEASKIAKLNTANINPNSVEDDSQVTENQVAENQVDTSVNDALTKAHETSTNDTHIEVVESGDTIGEVFYDGIATLNPDTSFIDASEVADMFIKSGMENFTIRKDDKIVFEKIPDKGYAYRIKAGSKTFYVKADKGFTLTL